MLEEAIEELKEFKDIVTILSWGIV